MRHVDGNFMLRVSATSSCCELLSSMVAWTLGGRQNHENHGVLSESCYDGVSSGVLAGVVFCSFRRRRTVVSLHRQDWPEFSARQPLSSKGVPTMRPIHHCSDLKYICRLLDSLAHRTENIHVPE